jgi:beta-glucosidase
MIAKLIEQGIDIKSYYHWSLMDNFEWAEGYTMRFGLYHVDYETQIRTLRGSGKAYQSIIKQHQK